MKYKRLVGCLLSGLMLFSTVSILPAEKLFPDLSVQVSALTSSEVTNAITNLKNTRYPEGYCWYNEYPTDAAATKVFNGSQCVGFARNVGNIVFGSFPGQRVSGYSTGQTLNGWTAIRGNDATYVEPGDIIRTDGHAAIVWYVDGDNIYVAEAWGSSGNTIHYGFFNGARKNATLAGIKANNSFLGIWRHPEYTNAQKPGWANVAIPKQHFKICEEVVFELSSDTGNSYTVGIDNEAGERVYTYNSNVDRNNTTQYYTHVFEKGGNYSCYITTYNDYGLADSGRIYFTVYDKAPSYAKVSTDKTLYGIGENVNFTFTSDTGNSYTLGIEDGEGAVRLYTYNSDVNLDTTTQYYTHAFDKPGNYSCYITAYNDYAAAESERIYFSVFSGDVKSEKPGWANVAIEKPHFKIGEEVIFELSSDTGNSYTVGIDDEAGNRVYTYNSLVDRSSTTQYYTHIFDKGGNYSCYITAYNDYGLTDSGRIYFTVYDKAPSYARVSTDKTLYGIGENVNFTFTSDTGNSYTLGIEDSKGTVRLYTYNSDVNLDTTTQYYTHAFDKPGNYSCYITAYNDYAAVESERIYFTIYTDLSTKFDANGGSCSTSSKSVTYSKSYGDLPIPTRNGYIFNGWYTDKESGSLITADTIVTATENHTLYAHWTTIVPSKPTLTVKAGTSSNETVFEWNACENTTHYDLRVYNSSDGSLAYAMGHIDQANQFESYATFTGTNFSKLLPAGSYYATVCSVNSNSGKWVSSDEVKFTVINADGDANNDGKINTVDVVMLHKYLHNSGKLTNWKNADLNKDGKINIYDLILMKRMIINNNKNK